MKLSHIILLIVIAVAVGVIVSTAGDASTYVSFAEAEKMAADGEEKSIHVVGKLPKDEKGRVAEMLYNPTIDANYFEFTLVDNNKRAQKVVYRSPKPADFDKSEQVVVIGAMRGETFQCEKILMKCPSKYKEGELEVKEATAKKV